MKYFLMILFTVFLTACSSAPKTPVLYEQQTMERVVGYEDLLRPCKLVAPPDRQTYLKYNRDEREDAMFQVYLEAVASINQCNLDKKAVLTIIDRFNQTVDKFNKTQEERGVKKKEKQ